MANALPKIVLSPSRDIPFDRLVLSQSNVRRVKAGVSIEDLADDIARRGLLHGINVRPQVDGSGVETGLFEVPAGGRRYRALETLVRRKRMAKGALVPCVVKASDGDVSAEEDSLAENTFREPLHPLDEFRGMQRLVEKGESEEAIAAHFRVTPAVVRQRLRLASVSPVLHEVYADGAMTLDQLMAFAVSDDHARQEQVWEILAHSINRSPAFIRSRLTENTVSAADRRALFVGVDAYVAAGGCVLRDLFEEDDGGWLQDAALLDGLVTDKLKAEAELVSAEGWKWVTETVDLPYGFAFDLEEIEALHSEPTPEDLARIEVLKAEADALEAQYANAADIPEEVDRRITAIDEELAVLSQGRTSYDPADIARAGAFVSLDDDGSLVVERGWVRAEDAVVAAGDDAVDGDEEADGEADGFIGPRLSGDAGADIQRAVITIGGEAGAESSDDGDDEVVKPLPDRLVSELTAERTLALQDAFAQVPATAFVAVLHRLVLSTFFLASSESCLGLSVSQAVFASQAPGLRDFGPAKAIAERHARWRERLPKADKDIWEALLQLDSAEQAALFAHCASYAVNALWEAVPKYDNGRVSAHSIARRIGHADVLARAVGLDMVGAGWRPTVANYLGRVTKPRILEAVAEAKGDQTAGLIDHLKKDDMAREAERLLADAGWLPEPLRTPAIEAEVPGDDGGECEALPAFLAGDGPETPDADLPVAAE